MKKKNNPIKSKLTKNKNKSSNKKIIYAVVANKKGEIFDLKGYSAVGNKGFLSNPLKVQETMVLPQDSELMFLPNRRPILYNLKSKQIEILYENPYKAGEVILPVAAFNSPGYLLTHTCSYYETKQAKSLPLFSYSAVGWYNGSFRSTIILIDNEPRQDINKMPIKKVILGIKQMKKILPKNIIRKQLEKCALIYGCPAGKNFFLNRYEAPLPTSKKCNADCLGCISLQKNKTIRSSQDRINFTPLAKDIADVALIHIKKVNRAIVSFGQGCEGDPLLAANTILKAIKIIRSSTNKGTININTNGSIPTEIEKLFTAGLDSIRISINSFRKECYTAYFRPLNYCFEDVLDGISIAISKKKHVAINYLSCPGFTDSAEEIEALKTFLNINKINMIQWRNLNFDPLRYIKNMNKVSKNTSPIGTSNLISKIKYLFPNVNHGYFNPPKEKYLYFTS